MKWVEKPDKVLLTEETKMVEQQARMEAGWEGVQDHRHPDILTPAGSFPDWEFANCQICHIETF